MAEKKEKVKIAYAMRPVETEDAEGKRVITYKPFHPVTTGNAVVVVVEGQKMILNKALLEAGKVRSVNGMTGDVEIPVPDNATAEQDGLMSKEDKAKLDELHYAMTPSFELDPTTGYLSVEEVNAYQFSVEDGYLTITD